LRFTLHLCVLCATNSGSDSLNSLKLMVFVMETQYVSYPSRQRLYSYIYYALDFHFSLLDT
jgi:hypothetical protein